MSNEPVSPQLPEQPSISVWYYSKNRQQQGPISEEQLRQLAATGQLQPSDLVWKHGMDQWAEARKLKGILHDKKNRRRAPNKNTNKASDQKQKTFTE